MWIFILNSKNIWNSSHSATKTIRVPYHKFYFDFQSPLLAYSPLASPARLPLMLPVSISAAANTANTLFTHMNHFFTVTCFKGGFMSTFECRWGHIWAAFGAAGAGSRGGADWLAAGKAGPAEGAESNTGNIPGWRSQVRGKYAARC